MLEPYGRELCDIPYVFLKTTSNMQNRPSAISDKPKRPKALKGMLVGKTKNDEMTLRSIQRIKYYTPKETAAITNALIKSGRVKRLI